MTRPRILMTPELLQRKRAETLTDLSYEGRWRTLRRTADGPALTEARRDWLPTLAAMYLLTGDVKYAARAEVLLTPIIASGLTLITPDSGKPVGQETFQVALCYDWLHEALSPTILAGMKATLEQWGQWPFPETNPIRTGKLGTDAPWSNYFYEFLRAAWLAGIALQDDSPVGDTLVALCQKKWTDRALLWLNQYCAGGWHVEGSNYGLGCLISMLQARLSDGPLDPWFYEALEVQYQMTTPGMGGKVPFSDQASDFPAVQSDTDRFAVLMMAALGGRIRQARYWLDNITRKRSLRGQSLWFEYLFYPSDIAPISYQTPERLSYYAKGAGYISRRSGWERDAVQVQLCCGPKFSDHQDDAGSFCVVRGNDWLIGHAKNWSASGLQHTAEFVNLPTVDGRPQDNMGDRTAKITFYEDTDSHLIAQMDLSRAYDYSITSSNRIRPLKSYRRTFVYLPGTQVLFIHDRIEKNNAASVVVWNLNTHGSGVGLYTEGRSQMSFDLVSTGKTVNERPLNLGSGGAFSSFQRNLVSPSPPPPVEEFLVVLQFGPAGFTPLPVTKTPYGAQAGDDEFQIDDLGTVALVDHRISPRDQAMELLVQSVDDWLEDRSETHVSGVVEAAQRLLSVVHQTGSGE